MMRAPPKVVAHPYLPLPSPTADVEDEVPFLPGSTAYDETTLDASPQPVFRLACLPSCSLTGSGSLLSFPTGDQDLVSTVVSPEYSVPTQLDTDFSQKGYKANAIVDNQCGSSIVDPFSTVLSSFQVSTTIPANVSTSSSKLVSAVTHSSSSSSPLSSPCVHSSVESAASRSLKGSSPSKKEKGRAAGERRASTPAGSVVQLYHKTHSMASAASSHPPCALSPLLLGQERSATASEGTTTSPSTTSPLPSSLYTPSSPSAVALLSPSEGAVAGIPLSTTSAVASSPISTAALGSPSDAAAVGLVTVRAHSSSSPISTAVPSSPSDTAGVPLPTIRAPSSFSHTPSPISAIALRSPLTSQTPDATTGTTTTTPASGMHPTHLIGSAPPLHTGVFSGEAAVEATPLPLPPPPPPPSLSTPAADRLPSISISAPLSSASSLPSERIPLPLLPPPPAAVCPPMTTPLAAGISPPDLSHHSSADASFLLSPLSRVEEEEDFSSINSIPLKTIYVMECTNYRIQPNSGVMRELNKALLSYICAKQAHALEFSPLTSLTSTSTHSDSYSSSCSSSSSSMTGDTKSTPSRPRSYPSSRGPVPSSQRTAPSAPSSSLSHEGRGLSALHAIPPQRTSLLRGLGNPTEKPTAVAPLPRVEGKDRKRTRLPSFVGIDDVGEVGSTQDGDVFSSAHGSTLERDASADERKSGDSTHASPGLVSTSFSHRSSFGFVPSRASAVFSTRAMEKRTKKKKNTALTPSLPPPSSSSTEDGEKSDDLHGLSHGPVSVLPLSHPTSASSDGYSGGEKMMRTLPFSPIVCTEASDSEEESGKRDRQGDPLPQGADEWSFPDAGVPNRKGEERPRGSVSPPMAPPPPSGPHPSPKRDLVEKRKRHRTRASESRLTGTHGESGILQSHVTVHLSMPGVENSLSGGNGNGLVCQHGSSSCFTDSKDSVEERGLFSDSFGGMLEDEAAARREHAGEDSVRRRTSGSHSTMERRRSSSHPTHPDVPPSTPHESLAERPSMETSTAPTLSTTASGRAEVEKGGQGVGAEPPETDPVLPLSLDPTAAMGTGKEYRFPLSFFSTSSTSMAGPGEWVGGGDSIAGEVPSGKDANEVKVVGLLDQLLFSANILGRRGLMPVLTIIRHCRERLVRLDLCGNALDNSSIQQLSLLLCGGFPKLKYIDLRHNRFTFQGGKCLARMCEGVPYRPPSLSFPTTGNTLDVSFTQLARRLTAEVWPSMVGSTAVGPSSVHTMVGMSPSPFPPAATVIPPLSSLTDRWIRSLPPSLSSTNRGTNGSLPHSGVDVHYLGSGKGTALSSTHTWNSASVHEPTNGRKSSTTNNAGGVGNGMGSHSSSSGGGGGSGSSTLPSLPVLSLPHPLLSFLNDSLISPVPPPTAPIFFPPKPLAMPSPPPTVSSGRGKKPKEEETKDFSRLLPSSTLHTAPPTHSMTSMTTFPLISKEQPLFSFFATYSVGYDNHIEEVRIDGFLGSETLQRCLKQRIADAIYRRERRKKQLKSWWQKEMSGWYTSGVASGGGGRGGVGRSGKMGEGSSSTGGAGGRGGGTSSGGSGSSEMAGANLLGEEERDLQRSLLSEASHESALFHTAHFPRSDTDGGSERRESFAEGDNDKERTLPLSTASPSSVATTMHSPLPSCGSSFAVCPPSTLSEAYKQLMELSPQKWKITSSESLTTASLGSTGMSTAVPTAVPSPAYSPCLSPLPDHRTPSGFIDHASLFAASHSHGAAPHLSSSPPHRESRQSTAVRERRDTRSAPMSVPFPASSTSTDGSASPDGVLEGMSGTTPIPTTGTPSRKEERGEERWHGPMAHLPVGHSSSSSSGATQVSSDLPSAKSPSYGNLSSETRHRRGTPDEEGGKGSGPTIVIRESEEKWGTTMGSPYPFPSFSGPFSPASYLAGQVPSSEQTPTKEDGKASNGMVWEGDSATRASLRVASPAFTPKGTSGACSPSALSFSPPPAVFPLFPPTPPPPPLPPPHLRMLLHSSMSASMSHANESFLLHPPSRRMQSASPPTLSSVVDRHASTPSLLPSSVVSDGRNRSDGLGSIFKQLMAQSQKKPDDNREGWEGESQKEKEKADRQFMLSIFSSSLSKHPLPPPPPPPSMPLKGTMEDRNDISFLSSSKKLESGSGMKNGGSGTIGESRDEVHEGVGKGTTPLDHRSAPGEIASTDPHRTARMEKWKRKERDSNGGATKEEKGGMQGEGSNRLRHGAGGSSSTMRSTFHASLVPSSNASWTTSSDAAMTSSTTSYGSGGKKPTIVPIATSSGHASSSTSTHPHHHPTSVRVAHAGVEKTAMLSSTTSSPGRASKTSPSAVFASFAASSHTTRPPLISMSRSTTSQRHSTTSSTSSKNSSIHSSRSPKPPPHRPHPTASVTSGKLSKEGGYRPTAERLLSPHTRGDAVITFSRNTPKEGRVPPPPPPDSIAPPMEPHEKGEGKSPKEVAFLPVRGAEHRKNDDERMERGGGAVRQLPLPEKKKKTETLTVKALHPFSSSSSTLPTGAAPRVVVGGTTEGKSGPVPTLPHSRSCSSSLMDPTALEAATRRTRRETVAKSPSFIHVEDVDSITFPPLDDGKR